MDFYFADPYSAWQRGSNENSNGLLREAAPKKTGFVKIKGEKFIKKLKRSFSIDLEISKLLNSI